ncbi:MAG: sugar phosphate isomerase/epimerase, partial [Microcoleus sp. SIO2G3]|nr:sugar phosphate isomerase/epimerase [Microcoleus sp. SIO2G3]
MTANYVARQLGYQMTEGWGQGDKRTQAYFKPLKTFATRFEEYLRDIKALGFDALDLWTAILHPDWATEDHIEAAVDALKAQDLTLTSYAGGFGSTDEEFEQVCELAADLGIGVLA